MPSEPRAPAAAQRTRHCLLAHLGQACQLLLDPVRALQRAEGAAGHRCCSACRVLQQVSTLHSLSLPALHRAPCQDHLTFAMAFFMKRTYSAALSLSSAAAHGSGGKHAGVGAAMHRGLSMCCSQLASGPGCPLAQPGTALTQAHPARTRDARCRGLCLCKDARPVGRARALEALSQGHQRINTSKAGVGGNLQGGQERVTACCRRAGQQAPKGSRPSKAAPTGQPSAAPAPG